MTQYDPNSNGFSVNGPGSDLLSQIAAEDDGVQDSKRKNKKTSTWMNMFVELMRLTFYFDELKRKYSLTFAILSWIWGIWIFVLYIGGACALALLIYSYSQFPDYVRKFFKDNQMLVQDFEMPEYTFSRLELKNLKDKAGTYTVKSLVINSTFADFLQRRVKSVVLDGVTIRMSADKQGNVDFGMLPRFLVNLNKRNSSHAVKIDTLSITNAVLELEGFNMKIPVSFSFTGVYEDDTKISVPFFVKQKEMDLMGTFSITGNQKKMSFVVDITSGTLTLPRKSPENVTAKMTIDTQSSKIDKIIGNIDLVYGRNTKKFKWNMSADKEEYRGTLDMSFVNVDVSEKEKELKSNVSLNFEGLKFKNLSDFETNRPIRVTVQSFYQPNVSVSRLFSTLNGRLHCTKQGCDYVLNRESPVSIEDMTFKYAGDTIRSVSETTFVFKPNAKKNLFTWNGSDVDYNAILDRVSFSGYKNSQISPITFKADGMSATGKYSFVSADPNLLLDIQRMDYNSIDQDLTNGKLKVSNVFDTDAELTLKTKAVFKNNPFFGVPVEMDMTHKGSDTKIQFSALDNKIKISFDGTARLHVGEFSGNVYIHPFDMKGIRVALSDISPLLPKDVQAPEGVVAGLGRLSWGKTSQISGPFYLAFKDVGFKRGNINVQGMNGVLLFQTLYPVMTASNQRIYVKQIDSSLPVKNVDMRFKMDNQFIRLNSLTADVAGVSLDSGSMLLPYRTPNMIVYLKNPAANLANLNKAVQKTGLMMSGAANVVFPLEFRDGKMSLKNGEVKISDADIRFSKDGRFKPEYMINSESYQIRSGTVLLNTSEDGNLLDVSLTTSGRVMPSGDKRNLHEVLSLDVKDLIQESKSAPVPQEIIQRQKVVIP